MIDETHNGSDGSGQFRLVLAPNRSLSRRGFLAVMILLAGISFICGIAFALLGAWPVLGFFGLDIAIVYFAFRLNYRSGREVELLNLDGDQLTLVRRLASGAQRTWVFNPYWARVHLDMPAPTVVELRLGSHGDAVQFGQFLSNDEKELVAREVRDVLAVYRASRA